MSMYGDYIKERLGDHIHECEEGFATYRYIDDKGFKAVYIVDIYVRPVFRKTGAASTIADIICEKAKQDGCYHLIGSVVPSANGSTESLKVLLGYGMSLMSSSNEMIVFKKEL